MLKLWKWKHHTSCPRCKECDIKTTINVLKCRVLSAKAVWDIGMRKLSKWIVSSHALLEMTNILTQRLDEDYPGL